MKIGSARIFVTKLSAAKRLLRAAIRLFFDKEDDLAVHAIAASAYGILKDLWVARGGNEAARATETFMLGLVSLAQEKTSGNLAPEVLADESFLRTLDQLIGAFQITPDSDLSKIDLSVVLDKNSTKHFWDDNNRVSNFLKHADNKFADRDEHVALAMDNVDNLTLLMRATSSYESLAPDDLGFEGVVFQIYVLSSIERSKQSATFPFAKQVEEMSPMPPEERIAFCSFQLRRPRPAHID